MPLLEATAEWEPHGPTRPTCGGIRGRGCWEECTGRVGAPGLVRSGAYSAFTPSSVCAVSPLQCSACFACKLRTYHDQLNQTWNIPSNTARRSGNNHQAPWRSAKTTQLYSRHILLSRLDKNVIMSFKSLVSAPFRCPGCFWLRRHCFKKRLRHCISLLLVCPFLLLLASNPIKSAVLASAASSTVVVDLSPDGHTSWDFNAEEQSGSGARGRTGE
jgi:hypothetical protein